jgi:class 3 adenylate cyclase/tetratricopeptide (TPR) repeat protein
MDLEDFHDLMLAYQRYCARCVEDMDGFVARFAGDGVLAYFGYPVAREDAPQRAVQAALLLRAAGQHLPQPAGQPLTVRIGIATGVVVVGDLLGQGPAAERAIAGETPNLAARLQTSAMPDTIVVSETTKQLAEGMFEFRALEPALYKGLSSPIRSWEVLGQSPTVNRFRARWGVGVSPLISREHELDELLKAWLEVRGGRRRVVGVVGDPGLGKSRLVAELRQRIGRESPVVWLEGGGASIFDNTPFHVVAQFIPDLVAQGIDAPAELRADSAKPGGDDDAGGTIGPIASLFSGLETPDPDDGGGNAAWNRATVMRALLQWLRTATQRGPTVLVVEDLHWVDPSTLEFLDLLAGDEEEQPFLLLYTSRADFTNRWPPGGRHQVITLQALDGEASAALVRAAAPDNRMSLPQIAAIVSQATGVPLYIEELVRLIAGKGASGSKSAIPSTLADLLSARLEGLGPAKRYAQIAAVLGQEFLANQFGAMVEQDDVDPVAALAELQASSIVVPARKDAQGHFVFRHALIATAAHAALLRGERRELHRRAADLIVERYPALAETQPQVLARHWTEAGDVGRAIAAWEKTGDSGNNRHAFREAEYAYREALSVLDGAASPAERDQSELRIGVKLNRVLQVTQGYSAVEVAQTSQRTRELAAKIGDAEALSREESAKWRSVFTAGDFAQADLVMSRVMALTESQGNAPWRQSFHLRAAIQQGFYTGNLTLGENAFLAWDEVQDGKHRGSGDDVLSMGIAALIAHMMGRQAVAEKRMRAAFAIAERRNDSYDLAMALHTRTCLDHFCRAPAQQAQSANRLAGVAGESGFEYAGHLATGWLAIASANSGDIARAREQVDSAIAGFERLGARVSMPFWLSVLGQTRELGGDRAGALRSYADAISYNPQERVFLLEVYLGRARLLKTMGDFDEAEHDLKEAIRIARDMGAASFQLRTMAELARLQMSIGDRVARDDTLRSLQGLMHAGYCAADLADVAALSRETGVAL